MKKVYFETAAGYIVTFEVQGETENILHVCVDI